MAHLPIQLVALAKRSKLNECIDKNQFSVRPIVERKERVRRVRAAEHAQGTPGLQQQTARDVRGEGGFFV